MPLPGGPSDKAGNRYELDWVVRRLVDLVIGRLDWLRIEPPGEHAIEFRCLAAGREEAHQVKRGVSGGGHWTIPALKDVLVGFGTILSSEPDVSCVFVSEHAAPELNELAERARGSETLAELKERFLAAQSQSRSWEQLSAVWGTSPDDTRGRLQRVEVKAISAGHLRDDTNAILQLLFASHPDLVRAALADLALGSVHRRLVSGDVLRHLLGRGIRRFEMGRLGTITPLTSPPPSAGITRVRELSEINALLGAGTITVHVGGITGIGKTTVAAQFASGWKGPVCWIDCGLLTSELEALSAISEFITQSLGVDSVAAALAHGRSRPEPVAQLAGKCLGARQCLVVWDGADGQVASALVPLIDSIATTLEGGGQVVTAQVRPETGRALLWGTVHVDRLDRAAVRRLLVEAQPDAGVTDLESADEFTQGHPYLVQLLVAALRTVDLGTALGLLKVDGGSDTLLARLLAELPESAVTFLRSAAWLEIPFSASQVSRLGGAPDLIRELADQYLLLRVGADFYRVHEVVGRLLRRAVEPADTVGLHERAGLFLEGIDHPSWLEIRAMVRHARAASLEALLRRAATALLEFATNTGRAALAREAAQELVNDRLGAKWSYPHFILGKCARMTSHLDVALRHYSAAETCADDPRSRNLARYERASVLFGLGRRAEADAIYTALAQEEAPATRAEARTALALGVAQDGDVAKALTLVDEAASIAALAGLVREEAEAWQARAEVLSGAERWEEARDAIRRAHSLRHGLMDKHTFDIYGWFHLLQRALSIERALKHKEGARGAAHGLWRFAVMSGSIGWEASAAHAMCLVDPDPDNEEVQAAVARLDAAGHESTTPIATRIAALEALVLCQWALRRHEAAVETIVEILAIGVEHKADVPVFGHLVGYPDHDENIVSMPGDGYGLLVPPGETPEFVQELASRVFERRPELAKYAVMLVGEVPLESGAAPPDEGLSDTTTDGDEE